ncbi:HNH endonuclease signature motif containing protein [Lentibacter algarum]|uniref:HNH endonuclease signature motif containing protein n=1 Tax=Lentibacter algarum TaxID=576131 RepID=UPI0026EE2538|nr:HNH endonuclease signature motif containing protein [Lentibacter algarum]
MTDEITMDKAYCTRNVREVLLCPDAVGALLKYNEATGELFWRKRTAGDFRGRSTRGPQHRCNNWNSRNAGRNAFTSRSSGGYLIGSIFKRNYMAHRVAWAVSHGRWPDGDIDHINGCRADNRMVNLREVSRSVNNKNSRLRDDNKTGVVGVHWHEGRMKWRAHISTGDGIVWLGSYEDFNDAVNARQRAEAMNGYHPNHGRVTLNEDNEVK